MLVLVFLLGFQKFCRKDMYSNNKKNKDYYPFYNTNNQMASKLKDSRVIAFKLFLFSKA